MKPGTEKGRRLSVGDRRQIRAELVTLARQSGARAFTYRYDGDHRVEFRAWPNGECVVQPVRADRDVSLAAPRRVTAVGVSLRVVGACGVALVALAEALARAL